MSLPFTETEFLEVFTAYNTAIWPAQIVLYAAGIVAALAAFRATARGDRIATWILSLYWLWMGLLYHLLFFQPVNPAAAVFGGLFIGQGLLFAWAAIRGSLRFAGPARVPGAQGILGIIMIFYSLLGYPLIGLLSGHVYPQAPLFGSAPCPTTIFTLGLLLMTRSPLPRLIPAVPLIWSAIGFTAALKLGVPEDFGLGAAGVLSALAFVAAAIKRRRTGKGRGSRRGVTAA